MMTAPSFRSMKTQPQRPLDVLRDMSGSYIEKGINAPSLSRDKKWHFVPESGLSAGCEVKGGQTLGTVQETSSVCHKIMVPPDVCGILKTLAAEDDYTVDGTAAVVDCDGSEKTVAFFQKWPIRVPRPVGQRLPLNIPLITGQRVIDTLFPLAKGGTVAIPGGFGTGKTMTQHAIAKWCDADIIVYVGCGERGNEMTDVLTEFPRLIDPRTGKSLMERCHYGRFNIPVGRSAARTFRTHGRDAGGRGVSRLSADENCRIL